MKSYFKFLAISLLSAVIITSCGDDDEVTPGPGVVPGEDSDFIGAVYAMTNGDGQVEGTAVQGANSIVAYGRNDDGSLELIGDVQTGGNGGDFDGGEGLDPLISAYALTKTVDNNFVLAVNAGSNSITSLSVQGDFSLSTEDTQSTNGVGLTVSLTSKETLME